MREDRLRSLRRRLAGALGLGVVVVAAVGAAAASAQEQAPGKLAAGEPVVIGLALAKTGWLGPYDGTFAKAIQLATEQVNARGGVKIGNERRKFVVVSSDAKSKLDVSAKAALDVIGKKAVIGVPMCDADFGAPAARTFAKNNILSISCAGAPGMGVTALGPLVYNVYTSVATEMAASAEWAHKKGWRSAYLLCDQIIEYTKILCEAFKTRWTELGGKVVGEDTFLNSDASVASQVTRMASAGKFDFLFLGTYPGTTPVVKQIRDRVKAPILASSDFGGAFWLKPTPTLSDFYMTSYGSPNGDDPRPSINQEFKTYAKKHGAPEVSSYVLLGKALVQTLVYGLEKAGTTDGPALAKALESKNIPTVLGPTTYTAMCHQPVGRGPYLIASVTNGKIKPTGSLVTPKKVPSYPC